MFFSNFRGGGGTCRVHPLLDPPLHMTIFMNGNKQPPGVILYNHVTNSNPPIVCYRNDLERKFLEMIDFNINVPASVYAKYYFDLRVLADANDLSFPLEPLNKERAIKLEVSIT